MLHRGVVLAILAATATLALSGVATAMFRDAKPIQQEYEKQVRAILTDEQEAEWEAMRKEAAQRMRERYRAGQAPE